VRFLQVGAQVVFVVLLALAGSWLGSNLLQALDALGLNLGLGFFKQTAGFVIGQGPPMERSDTFLRAYVVGVANTLSVISLGLALATILGILAGVSLVSPNWLLRSIVRIYVEVVRNTPLLVQLFFLYFAVILQLPSLKDRITLGPVVLSQRGLYLPRAIPGQHQLVWLGLTVGAIIAATVVYSLRLRRRIRTGEETRPGLWATTILVGVPLLGWFALPGDPYTLQAPQLEGLRMVGGTRLTPEFAGILLGLVIYTAAFIADIVRAGLLAVAHGQREAARSLGLHELQVLRFVVLPQALRLIIPPTTNQFLNLAKNSSLAIGIGFPDLYAVSHIIFSQSGQAVQVIALVMATYLSISLLISFVMNALNARLRIPGR